MFASVTKVFTATLLSDMVERGEVSLNDPISKYLPTSLKTPTRDGKEITLLDLSTQTSGLPRLPGNFAPKNGLNPYAVQVMAEVGVDISGQQSTLIEELPVQTFDYVVTLCGHAHETCPYFPGKLIHHGFADPPHLAAQAKTEAERLDIYRLVRDQIRVYIETLPAALAPD